MQAVHLISSLGTIGQTDNRQQKPTEIQRLSSLFSVRDCLCLSIELAQNKHTGRLQGFEGSALDLQAAFADNNIHKSLSAYLNTG